MAQTVELKHPCSIDDAKTTYVLDHTLIEIGSVLIEVVCGPKTLASIWTDIFGNATVERADRHVSVPVFARVDWTFGLIFIQWTVMPPPDHEIQVRYEYQEVCRYIPTPTVNWLEEGF